MINVNHDELESVDIMLSPFKTVTENNLVTDIILYFILTRLDLPTKCIIFVQKGFSRIDK